MALGWVILNNALAPLMHYSESPTLVPLQILHNAQLTILYCPIKTRWHCFNQSKASISFDYIT